MISWSTDVQHCNYDDGNYHPSKTKMIIIAMGCWGVLSLRLVVTWWHLAPNTQTVIFAAEDVRTHQSTLTYTVSTVGAAVDL